MSDTFPWRFENGHIDVEDVRGADEDTRYDRLCEQVAVLGRPLRIREQADLVVLAAVLGTRPDWHEPDEQELTAVAIGDSFDNSGCWPMVVGREAGCEMYVALIWRGTTVAHVNLATLFAWASTAV